MNKFLVGAAIGATLAYLGHRCFMKSADGFLTTHSPKKEEA